MTTVSFCRNSDTYTVKCQGHATGSENICAAVSSIVYTLAGYLLNSENIKVLTNKTESGNAEFIFSGGAEAAYCYKMAVIGLSQLAKSFPNFVKIK